MRPWCPSVIFSAIWTVLGTGKGYRAWFVLIYAAHVLPLGAYRDEA